MNESGGYTRKNELVCNECVPTPMTIGQRVLDNLQNCSARLGEIDQLLYTKIEPIVAMKEVLVDPTPKRDRFPAFFEHVQVQIDNMNATMDRIVNMVNSIQL